VVNRTARAYSQYGSPTHKQVYIYGALDVGPTELARGYGMAWGVGGWLVLHVLERLGPAVVRQMKERVARDLKTTFASHYSQQGTLADALTPAAIAAYGRRATGQKYLIVPHGGA